jgi:predicted RNA-binding Zn-ribbon protein involved in translation (DUF1610 family)
MDMDRIEVPDDDRPPLDQWMEDALLPIDEIVASIPVLQQQVAEGSTGAEEVLERYVALHGDLLTMGLPAAWLCPRCGTYSGRFPAASRWDSKTAVCSDCGLDEGVLEFQDGTYRQGSALLDPDMTPWYSREVGAPEITVEQWNEWCSLVRSA